MSNKGLLTYIEWYSCLLCWTCVLVPREAAKMVVRRALALTFLDACNALETEDGPYLRSVDHLYSIMQRQMLLTPEGNYLKLFESLPRPGEQQLHEIAGLYAATYEVTFEARLTLSHRAFLQMQLQRYSPVWMDDDKLSESLTAGAENNAPLRRVVQAMHDHKCDGRLICTASEELWKMESEKGRRWLSENSV